MSSMNTPTQQSERMEKNTEGKTAITKVLLRPSATFSGARIPDPGEIEHMHHRAHELCFIANSVKDRSNYGNRDMTRDHSRIEMSDDETNWTEFREFSTVDLEQSFVRCLGNRRGVIDD